MQTRFIIEVNLVADLSELSEDDIDPDGSCGVDGLYSIEVLGDHTHSVEMDHILEQIVEKFEDSGIVSDLDHFDVSVRLRTEHDSEEDMRGSLGLTRLLETISEY